MSLEKKAIKGMKRRKATGKENIPVNLLKELGENGINILTEIINDIYCTSVGPQDFLKVTIIALKKKPQAKKCSVHRTIISLFGKVVTRIFNRRLAV